MNRDQIEGSWKQVFGKLGERWSEFLDDAEGADAARQTQLVGNRQVRRGVLREQTTRQLSEFHERHREWDAPGREERGRKLARIS